jgi:hypothetical protein
MLRVTVSWLTTRSGSRARSNVVPAQRLTATPLRTSSAGARTPRLA